MSLQADLEELADPTKRPSASQQTHLSDLDEEDARILSEWWPDVEASRRLLLVTELTELAEDNVDLNFSALFKVALHDSDAEIRAASIRGLYEYEARDLIGRLIDILLTDPASEVRREAAIALGRYALAAELGHLTDADATAIRNALIESAEDLEEDERVRARAIEALGALSGEDTENLIESIYDEDSLWLKVGAVDAMGRSCDSIWLPIILRESENRAPEMRHAAAFAAGEIGDEDAVPRLKRMAVEDPDRQVQLAAIHALGEIGGPQARVALQQVLYEGDDALREAIEEALSEIAFHDDPLGSL
jgi:HEAT repeat protein